MRSPRALLSGLSERTIVQTLRIRLPKPTPPIIAGQFYYSKDTLSFDGFRTLKLIFRKGPDPFSLLRTLKNFFPITREDLYLLEEITPIHTVYPRISSLSLNSNI